MEFIQEPTFKAFLAFILSIVVAKIVSFAVSNSNTDVNTVDCAVNEGGVAKDVTLDNKLRVKKAKGQKRVKFVDDVVIRTVDRFEGPENLDQFVDNGLSEDPEVKKTEEQCFDVREMHDFDAHVKGFEKDEILIEKEGFGDIMESEGELEGDDVITDQIVGNGVKGTGEQKSEGGLEGGDVIADEIVGNGAVGTGENEGVDTGNMEEEDADWEGIERSDLEKVFAEAVNYLEYGGKGKDKEDDQLAKLSSDVQMQLYGLHKVAVEGPCREPQPMALMVSARAKWNAWQKMGSMSEEVAMEQYIRLLSDNIPAWMHHSSADGGIEEKSETLGEMSVAEQERKPETGTQCHSH